ncbi:UNKNOWN [Stylonychia lemnae]|uniref:Uncharacterized protein n=1 Tax=Stylonychia lemnae TaxID=5949 RepID=A0A078A2S8_STYLE|nr:UNKNOWN [Stylonychia lemnae]|eukprot:CDW75089.1 UNKNOWN [Stylonychia lemnae]
MKSNNSGVPNLQITLSPKNKQRLRQENSQNQVDYIYQSVNERSQNENDKNSKSAHKQQVTFDSQPPHVKVITIPQRTTGSNFKEGSFGQNQSKNIESYDNRSQLSTFHSQISSSNGQQQFQESERSRPGNQKIIMINQKHNTTSSNSQSKNSSSKRPLSKAKNEPQSTTNKMASKNINKNNQAFNTPQQNFYQTASKVTAVSLFSPNELSVDRSNQNTSQTSNMFKSQKSSQNQTSIKNKRNSRGSIVPYSPTVQQIVGDNPFSKQNRQGLKTPSAMQISQRDQHMQAHLNTSSNQINFQSARTRSQQQESSATRKQQQQISTITLKLDAPVFNQNHEIQSSIQQVNDTSMQSKTQNLLEQHNFNVFQHQYSVNLEDELDNAKRESLNSNGQIIYNIDTQRTKMKNINTDRGRENTGKLESNQFDLRDDDVTQFSPHYSTNKKLQENIFSQKNLDIGNINDRNVSQINVVQDNDTSYMLGYSQVQIMDQRNNHDHIDDGGRRSTSTLFRENQQTYRKCYHCSRQEDQTKVSRQTSPIGVTPKKSQTSRQTSKTPRSNTNQSQRSISPSNQFINIENQLKRKAYSKSPEKKQMIEVGNQTQQVQTDLPINNQSFNTYQSPGRQSRINLLTSPQNKQIEELLQQSFSNGPMGNEHVDNIVKYLNQTKTDEQNLSKMVESEKIFVIQRYESLIQKLVIEYNKIQAQNNEIRASFANENRSVQSQFLIINSQESQIQQMSQRIAELEHKNLNSHKEMQLLRQKLQVEQDNNYAEKKHLEMAKQQLFNQVAQLQDTEVTLRARNAQIQEDNHQMEYAVKQLKEQCIKIETEKRVFEMEMQKTRVQEQSMNQELNRIKQLNIEQDAKIQEYRSQLEQLVQTLKRKDQEFEQLSWDSQGLKSSVDILHKNQQAILLKNNQLKDELGKLQIEKQSYQTQIEQALNQKGYQGLNMNNLELISKNNSPKVRFNESMNDYYQPNSPKRNSTSRNDVKFFNPNKSQDESLELNVMKYLNKSPITNLRKDHDLSYNQNLSNNNKIYDKRFVTNDSSSINQVFKWPNTKDTNLNSYKNINNNSNFNSFGGSAVKRHQIDLANLNIGIQDGNLSSRSIYNSGQHSQQRSLSQSSEPDNLPAAGKKSGLHQKYQQSQQNINNAVSQLQNAMIEQLLKKTQIEEDLKDLSGRYPKSRDILERKQELENNLDIINKNVLNLKDKIKSLE